MGNRISRYDTEAGQKDQKSKDDKPVHLEA